MAAFSGLLQRYLPDAHVVKAFSTIFFKHLASPARPRRPGPPAAPRAAAHCPSPAPTAGPVCHTSTHHHEVPRPERHSNDYDVA